MTINPQGTNPDLSAAASVTDAPESPDASAERGKRDALTLRQLYTRRFVRHKGGMLGVAILLALIAFSIFGGLLTEHDYQNPDFLALGEAPSGSHYFGTNQGGLDTYAMTVHGLQRSIIIAVATSALTTLISAIIGAWAAYAGGKIEKTVLALIHFLLVIPTFLLLALVSNHYSGDWRILIVVLTLFGWMFSARVVWTLATSVREREYVMAAKFMVVSTWKTVTRHVVPNIGSLLIVNFTLGVVGTVLSETALSFIGFGVKLPDVSLGTMLSDGSSTVYSTPWLFAFPSLFLVLLTVSMFLIGDGLRDALDPNSKSGGNA